MVENTGTLHLQTTQHTQRSSSGRCLIFQIKMSFGFTRLLQSPLRAFAGFGAPVNRQIHHITGFNPAPATRIMPCTIQNSSSQLVEAGSSHMTAGGAWSFITTRFWRRIEHVKEQKRIRKYSWKVRMSTEKGRVIIMKRMLAGRHVYTH